MRVVFSSATVGCLVLMASSLMAPQDQLVPTLSAGTAVSGMAIQSVDRSNKGDRLVVTKGEQDSARTKPQKMLAGCDPAFSPLAVSAKANFPRRCAA